LADEDGARRRTADARTTFVRRRTFNGWPPSQLCAPATPSQQRYTRWCRRRKPPRAALALLAEHHGPGFSNQTGSVLEDTARVPLARDRILLDRANCRVYNTCARRSPARAPWQNQRIRKTGDDLTAGEEANPRQDRRAADGRFIRRAYIPVKSGNNQTTHGRRSNGNSDPCSAIAPVVQPRRRHHHLLDQDAPGGSMDRRRSDHPRVV